MCARSSIAHLQNKDVSEALDVLPTHSVFVMVVVIFG